jgi:hypothetical protein
MNHEKTRHGSGVPGLFMIRAAGYPSDLARGKAAPTGTSQALERRSYCCGWMHSTPNTSPPSSPGTLSGVGPYRTKMLVGKLAALLEQAIRRLCEVNTWTRGALHVQADHVHLFLSAPPNMSPSRDGLTCSKARPDASSFTTSLK